MSIDVQLTAALKTVAARVSPHPAPENTTRPYVTYQRVTGKRHTTLNSGAGAPRADFQVDVWANSKGEARTLADSLIDALPGLLKVGDISDNPDDYEPDTKLHRASFDVTLWR